MGTVRRDSPELEFGVSCPIRTCRRQNPPCSPDFEKECREWGIGEKERKRKKNEGEDVYPNHEARPLCAFAAAERHRQLWPEEKKMKKQRGRRNERVELERETDGNEWMKRIDICKGIGEKLQFCPLFYFNIRPIHALKAHVEPLHAL